MRTRACCRRMSTWLGSDLSRELVIDVVAQGEPPESVACVVTDPWRGFKREAIGGRQQALLNPANSSLAGTARNYFPRGGPVPPAPPTGLEASSAGWGGLDAGPNMLYPAQVVDGLTHMHAGPELRAALAALPTDAAGTRCEIGAAVLSAPFRLGDRFDVIAHTPTPFWPASSDDSSVVDEWRRALRTCYLSGFSALIHEAPLGRVWCDESAAVADARSAESPFAVASPLLGAGAAGAPVHAAAEVAVEALASLSARGIGHSMLVRLVVADVAARHAVESALTVEAKGRGRIHLA